MQLMVSNDSSKAVPLTITGVDRFQLDGDERSRLKLKMTAVLEASSLYFLFYKQRCKRVQKASAERCRS